MKLNALSRIRFWKTAFLVGAFCLASVIPFFVGTRSGAQTTSTTGTWLVAPLTGPTIGGVTPRGVGRHFVDSMNNRFLDVEVREVNLPANTMLGVFIGDTSVGQIRLSSLRNGLLRVNSTTGTIPPVISGTAITVKNADATILSGSFAPPPTPSPSPTFTPPPSPTPLPSPSVSFFAQLNGPAINGVAPRGMGQYAEFGTARRLNVYVNHVRLPGGTVLNVLVSDVSIGNITLNGFGEGVLRLDSSTGSTVPTVVSGDSVKVKNGDAVILSGTFGAYTTPSPTPTVSPSPSPTHTPWPTPSPRPNRAFAGFLNGSQVVPPVTTQGRGYVGVVLNQTETSISVYLGFYGLSSAQTSAKIHGPAMVGETAPAVFDLGAIGGTSGRFPVRTFAVTAEQVTQLRTGLFYVQIGTADNPGGEIRGQIRSRTRPSNFLGAETEDIAVYRPSTGTWFVKEGAGYSESILGNPGDVPVSGDFDGDGKTDNAVFRNGTWLVRRSSDGGLTTKQFGLAGDVPIRGDYDGDGQSDLAVFRPSTGIWYIEKSNGSGHIIVNFGVAGDVPVASDLDGDGRTDITVFRPSSGTWYWIQSSNGAARGAQFGSQGDVPIAGDFDGDGQSDLAVYRASTGVWYAYRSSDGTYDIRQFGLESDIPVAGNYDSDGKTDIAVYRGSTGTWYIWRSSDNTYEIKYFGTSSDVPTTRN